MFAFAKLQLCTHIELVCVVPGPEADGFGGMQNLFLMMMLWIGLAFALFFLRPKSLRSQPAEKPGPSTSSDGSSRQQPPGNDPPVM